MSKNIFVELEDRRSVVEKFDFDMQDKNRDHFRSFWLHMVILSSAIVIGVLPILNAESDLITSPILAKLGLLIIVLVGVSVIFYFQNVLSREKLLLFEQIQFHEASFFKQQNLLAQAVKDRKSEMEISQIFEGSKDAALIKEEEIIAKHLIGGKFLCIRLFIDEYFSHFISLGFGLGVLFVILSFIL